MPLQSWGFAIAPSSHLCSTPRTQRAILARRIEDLAVLRSSFQSARIYRSRVTSPILGRWSDCHALLSSQHRWEKQMPIRKAVLILTRASLAALAISLALAGIAAAQTKVTIGIPPVPEFVLPMIAVEKGYFKDQGINATIRIIPGGQSM